MTDTTAISAAVQVMGSQKNLAAALGMHVTLVSQWCTGRRPVAAHQCIPIERATRGRVTRYALRPDVFGDAERAA